MRIQHNIPAMSAYRNYTNNVSAMKKNLEKLSSGYKINRAGDDAAGLAISEKMRAQITGLQTAQKNAKDGISLVQTAEGALTEVHDMLNRMVELASMSANGTYDNETDRNQLQKEMNQLRSEIDRIADSANFNGIKLLDGSLSESGIASVSNKFDLPGVGLTLGKDTVLHRDEDENAASTAFGLELHNVKFTGKAGDQFTIDIGGTKMVGTLAKDMDGSDLNNTLKGEDMVAGLLGTDTTKVTFADENGTAIDPTKITIGGKEYNMSAGVTKPSGPTEGTGILFKLNDPETNVEVSMDVKVYAGTDPNAAAGAGEQTTSSITGSASTSVEVVPAAGGVTGRGSTAASANVNVHTSTGVVDRTGISFAKKDGITGTTPDAHATVKVTGNDINLTFDGAGGNNSYAITLDASAINDLLTAKEGATAGSVTAGDLSLAVNGNNLELQLGGTSLGTLAINGLTNGTAANFVISDGTNNHTVGTITASQKAGGTYDATEAPADVTAGLAAAGPIELKAVTIKAAAFTDTDQQEAFTKAAIAAGAGTGNINLVSDGTTVSLKVGDTVVGTANAGQLNNTNTLEFTSAAGDVIGQVTLDGNSELTAADLAGLNMDTGLDYTDARVKTTGVSTVDHEAVAAAVKELVTDAGKDIGDGKLDITFDGTDMKLMLGNTEIATGALAGGTITFTGSDAARDTLFTLTLSDNTATIGANANTDLAGDAATAFEEIGLEVTVAPQELKTANTTGLATTANLELIGAAATKAAEAAGVDLTDGTALKISYNSTDDQYELKAGDVVIGTAAGNTAVGAGGAAADELKLSFTATTAAGGAALGDVTIGSLKTDFKATDLNGEIDTGLTYDAGKTPAINADFSGLKTDKLKEAAEAANVDADTTVRAVYDGTDWKLQFSNGAQIGTTVGQLSTDKKSVSFGDYGTITFDKEFDTAKITASGAAVTTDPIETGLKYGETSFKSGLKGDFLVTTSDQQNTEQTAGDRLASTVLTLNDSMITDGASIFVAGKNYTFSTGKDTVMPEGAVKVDISDLDPKKDNYMSSVVKRLTDAYAADNTGVYTLGWNGKNVTVTETVTHANLKSDGSNDDTYADDGWDLRTMDGIAKSLGYSSAATKGKALTLQIGDTADKFNQMDISVNDMHTYAMGAKDGDTIADVDISTQEGAAKAVDTIKSAINYVSDVRGTLGATQNRLDHTINNLSVMTENIQDAESTIRDTDVAEEMMEYTKNNILIQSAQAMLAQANQMPQGVLQLLQ